MKAAWWPHTTDAKVASFRLRCLQIVEALERGGHAASIYTPGDTPPDVLVLSKRYDPASVQAALALARTHGTRVVLDLCDNHFFHDPAFPDLAKRAQSLRDAVAAAHLVTCASQALAEVVRAECPDARAVRVVDDAAEPPVDPGVIERVAGWRHEAALQGLSRGLARSAVPPGRRLVWFGNRGSPGVQAGLEDLHRLRPLLEASRRDGGPLSLTIISNDAAKARQVVDGWAVPTHYLAWHAGTFSRALRQHSVALIPINLNPFTRCKTANRVLSACLHGLNVVADSIPSYAPFAGAAVLDDWAFGLGPYLGQDGQRRAHLQAGQALARERYSLGQVATQWVDALAAASSTAPASNAATAP